MDDHFETIEAGPTIQSGRRNFLSAIVATVTVAAVTGGTAALLLEDDGPPAPSITSPVATKAPSAAGAAGSAATSTTDAAYLRLQLATLQAENGTLKASLTAAQQQLSALAGAEAESSAGEAWRRQFEEASAQAMDLAGQLAVVQGLLSLYEELEAVDLAEAASGGVAAVGGALGELIADVPSVSEGLQAGRNALDEFEAQLPLIEQGRYWLEGQMTIVRSAWDAVELALNRALRAGGSFLQLLDRWFEDILKWLPFGFGEKAQAIMTALNDLLARVPETLDGLQANVAGPLDQWLERDGDEIRLQRRLIKPVREEAFDRAGSAVERFGSVNEVYELQLRQPVASQVERQQAIRQQIARYREDHSL